MVIVLIIPLSIACMNIPDKDETTIFWWEKEKDSIDTIDATNKDNLNIFLKKNAIEAVNEKIWKKLSKRLSIIR